MQAFPIKLILVTLLILNISISAQTKVSNGSGNWNNASTWLPVGVPTSSDDVLITGNDRVDIVSNSSCRSLTVGTSGTAQLRFNSGTNLTFSVSGNIIVGTNAQFRVRGANATHTLFASGNITNNGTINFYRSANRNAELILTGSGNQNISGGGVLTQLHLIKLKMGNSFNNIADFSTSSFVVNSDFLQLFNGTFKYSTISAINITPFNTAITIPSTAGFWMNAASSAVSLPAGIVVSGKLTNSTGTTNVGNATNEELIYSSGTLSITGGVVNIAGRFNGASASSTCAFSMSGGTLNVPTVGSTNSTNSPFNIASSGSQFNMSGGLILIPREGSGTGVQDLGYVNLASSGSVTGGSLQIGSTVANQIMKINSTASIPNLLINNATATASVFTNPMTVAGNIVINSGILNSNNLNISLGGNWQNNGGTFTAGTSSVTFNSNTAQTIFKSGGETFNHLVFNGTGVKTCSAAVTANGNVTINSGSSLDVSTSNNLVTIKGNFSNSGNFVAQNGTVLFNGNTNQSIGGTSTTDFYNITLNNTAGAILNSNENLIGTLTLNNGTFNTNLKIFTMISTATATARIAQLTGTGDISGIVRVQRYIPGGSTGWALIGTPISSALSFSDWDDNIAISCPSCPDGYVSNFTSIYSYDETVSGSYSNTTAYIPINTINDPIVSNKGYWVYVGDGLTTTNNLTIDVIGTVRKGNQTIPLNYTNYGSPSDDGWNLIHNPYPSAISWASLKGTTSNIDNAIYTYNADLNGGAGANAVYVNGVSSPAVGSGGIGDVIPMCQAFYVHSTGATALNATEANKVAGNPTFLRTSSTNSTQLVRLKLNSSTGFIDESVIYTQAGSLSTFDPSFDAIKMAGQDPYAPSIALENGSTIFQINGIPPIAGTFTTFVKTLTGYSGSYTVSADEFTTFPNGTCFNLYDRFTNTSTDLTQTDYVFNLDDTTTVSRFVLSISLSTLQITAQVTQPTCSNVNGGAVSAIGNSNGPWNYYWKDATNQIIKTSLQKYTADTLSGLYAGAIGLEITTVGGCDNNQSSYLIIQQTPSYANFLVADTCYLSESPVVTFNNASLNSVNNFWNFGDLSNTSTVISPTHSYQNEGVYQVKLKTISNTNCVDSIIKPIVVLSKPVGIKEINSDYDKLKVRTIGLNHYMIEQHLKKESSVAYVLYNSAGTLVKSSESINSKTISIDLNLGDFDAGIYFLKVTIDRIDTQVKLPVTK